MATYEEYTDLIETLVNKYSLKVESEHQYIHEFKCDEFDIFKLILGQPNSEELPLLVISFHLDVPTSSAIEWYLRVQSEYPKLRLTESYLKDDQGNSCVGEEADILKMYQLEQEIIETFIKSEKTEEEILKPIRVESEKTPKVFLDEKAAILHFKSMTKKKGDTYH